MPPGRRLPARHAPVVLPLVRRIVAAVVAEA